MDWTMGGKSRHCQRSLWVCPTQPAKPPKYFAFWPAHSFLRGLSLAACSFLAGTDFSWCCAATLFIPLHLSPRHCHNPEQPFPCLDALTKIYLSLKGLIRHHVCKTSLSRVSSLQINNVSFYTPSRLPLCSVQQVTLGLFSSIPLDWTFLFKKMVFFFN